MKSGDADRSARIAITSIDASGKGYLSAKVVRRLQAAGLRAVAISVDG